MNKVVSIEVARQIFWVEQAGYESLQSYFKTLKEQLAQTSDADEVFKDFELRAAEILFEYNSSEKRALSFEQIQQTIDRIGYLESSDDVDRLPRRITRNTQGKIIAGVCSGLACRFGVPAFILRLAFLAAAAGFGIGIVLYLIFWLSLDADAPGGSQTISKVTVKRSFGSVLASVIFLPFSLLGALLSVITGHFAKRSKFYRLVVKNILAVVVLLVAFLIGLLIVEFVKSRIFPWPISWLLSLAAAYLVVVGLATFFKEYYFGRKPRRRIDKRFKLAAAIPGGLIIAGVFSMFALHIEHAHKIIERSFPVAGDRISVVFDDMQVDEKGDGLVRYRIRNNPNLRGEVTLAIDYSSAGASVDTANKNIESINYDYRYENGTLTLDSRWKLEEGALNRGQHVEVLIELPSSVIVSSSRALSLQYLREQPTYYVQTQRSSETLYYASGNYIHDFAAPYVGKLSDNEREALLSNFCKAFFLSESWHCDYNVRTPIDSNTRFDKAFEEESAVIETIRVALQPDRSVLNSQLFKLNALADELSAKYTVLEPFKEHTNQLVTVKSLAASSHLDN